MRRGGRAAGSNTSVRFQVCRQLSLDWGVSIVPTCGWVASSGNREVSSYSRQLKCRPTRVVSFVNAVEGTSVNVRDPERATQFVRFLSCSRRRTVRPPPPSGATYSMIESASWIRLKETAPRRKPTTSLAAASSSASVGALAAAADCVPEEPDSGWPLLHEAAISESQTIAMSAGFMVRALPYSVDVSESRKVHPHARFASGVPARQR